MCVFCYPLCNLKDWRNGQQDHSPACKEPVESLKFSENGHGNVKRKRNLSDVFRLMRVTAEIGRVLMNSSCVYTAYKSLNQRRLRKQTCCHFLDCNLTNLLLKDGEGTLWLFTMMKKWSESGSEQLDHIKAHLIWSKRLCDERGEMTTCTGLRWPRWALLTP